MCFSKPSVDNSALIQQQQEAAQARQREEERNARIRQGLAAIDTRFEGARDITGYTARPGATMRLGDLVSAGLPTLGVGGVQFDPAALSKYGFTQGYAQAPADPNGVRGVTPIGPQTQTGNGGVPQIDANGNPVQTGATGTPAAQRRTLTDAAGNVVWTEGDAFDPNATFSYTAQDPTYGPQHGGFDDAFYKARNQAVMDFYNPQLQDRFRDARNKLTFALSRAGTLNSTMAGTEQGRLQREYGVQQSSIQSRANNEENALRTRVQNEKSALVNELNATGDADRASNEALARSQNITAETPKYDSLGDIFAGFASGIGQYFQGANEGRILNAYNSYSPRASSPSRTVT